MILILSIISFKFHQKWNNISLFKKLNESVLNSEMKWINSLRIRNQLDELNQFDETTIRDQLNVSIL